MDLNQFKPHNDIDLLQAMQDEVENQFAIEDAENALNKLRSETEMSNIAAIDGFADSAENTAAA
jgi:hypothetical protein